MKTRQVMFKRRRKVEKIKLISDEYNQQKLRQEKHSCQR